MNVYSKMGVLYSGFLVCVGILIGWMYANGPETIEVVGKTTVDTVIVKDTVIQTFRDTVKSKPVIKYIPRQIHDTIFIAEKVREYDTQKRFSDSALVRHFFGIRDDDNILAYNRWNYTPAPKKWIIKEVEKKIYPSKMEKAIKTVGWFAAGAGLTSIIANNVK